MLPGVLSIFYQNFSIVIFVLLNGAKKSVFTYLSKAAAEGRRKYLKVSYFSINCVRWEKVISKIAEIN